MILRSAFSVLAFLLFSTPVLAAGGFLTINGSGVPGLMGPDHLEWQDQVELSGLNLIAQPGTNTMGGMVLTNPICGTNSSSGFASLNDTGQYFTLRVYSGCKNVDGNIQPNDVALNANSNLALNSLYGVIKFGAGLAPSPPDTQMWFDHGRLQIGTVSDVGAGRTLQTVGGAYISGAMAAPLVTNSTHTDGSQTQWLNSGTFNGAVGSAKHLFTSGSATDFGLLGLNHLWLGAGSSVGITIDNAQHVGLPGYGAGVLSVNGSGDISSSAALAMPLYSASGTAKPSAHAVIGTNTLSGGSVTVTLSGAAIYTGSGTYNCAANDTGGIAIAASTQNISGSQFVIYGTGSGAVSYHCIGN